MHILPIPASQGYLCEAEWLCPAGCWCPQASTAVVSALEGCTLIRLALYACCPWAAISFLCHPPDRCCAPPGSTACSIQQLVLRAAPAYSEALLAPLPPPAVEAAPLASTAWPVLQRAQFALLAFLATQLACLRHCAVGNAARGTRVLRGPPTPRRQLALPASTACLELQRVPSVPLGRGVLGQRGLLPAS